MAGKKAVPALVIPEAPEWLDILAREEWKRSLEAIDPRDVATIDLSLYEVYCQSFARWKAAEQHLQEHGTEVTVRNDKGEVKQVLPSPQVAISEKSHAQMCKARKQCGLERARGLA